MIKYPSIGSDFESPPLTRSEPLDRFLHFVLLLLPSLIMIGPLTHGAIPYFMDTVMYFFPLRVHAAHLLARGEWPLWNRSIMAGMPLFENPQAALAYPLNWPFLAQPRGFWFTFPLTLQLGMYGALTAWSLRKLGIGRWPALWGGALALAGGYGWSRLQFGNYLNVLPWWPLWLGAACVFAQTLRLRWVLFGALAVALSILGGAHQLAAYGLLVLALFALTQILTNTRSRWRWLFYSLTTFLLGLAVAAPGWLPQLSFIKETNRPGGLPAAQVLAGSVGSWAELARALAGDGSLLKWRPGAPWADAESSAAIGLAALVLACIVPARRPLRRVWLGFWLAALVSVALSLRSVMTPLLGFFPPAGIFHDPRRWLGATQWLLIVNAAIGVATLWSKRKDPTPQPHATIRRLVRFAPAAACFFALALSLGREPWSAPASRSLAAIATLAALLTLIAGFWGRQRWSRRAGALLLTLALLLTAQATWVTTDCKTVLANAFTHPPAEPLILQAGLHPGQRFFTLDWTRAASYDYTRSDLLDWALPNLAMLWDVEDLGGYEPAQSLRYRAYIKQFYADEPWRQPYAEHFGLIQCPLVQSLLDEADVRAAIFPRWGLPMFFVPRREKGLAQAVFPRIFGQNFLVRLLFSDGDASSPLQLAVKEDAHLWRYSLKSIHRLSTEDDLIAPPKLYGIKREEPPGAGHLFSAEGDIPPQWGKPTLWLASLPPAAHLIDVFAWGVELRKLWQPVAIGSIAALMHYRGAPTWLAWQGAQCNVFNRTIKANRLELKVNVATDSLGTRGTRITIHDAWWPGWRAWVDNQPVELTGAGLWRTLWVPTGPHTILMLYRPATLGISLIIMACGLVFLLGLTIVLPLAFGWMHRNEQ